MAHYFFYYRLIFSDGCKAFGILKRVEKKRTVSGLLILFHWGMLD